MVKTDSHKHQYKLYLEYAPYWLEVRRKMRLKHNWACALCGDHKNIETHHLTYYDEKGKSIKGNELNHLDKLILLCHHCHIDVVHRDKNHVLNPLNYKKQNGSTFEKRVRLLSV